MHEQPILVRAARRIARGLASAYPRSLHSNAPETLAFVDDALDDGWRTYVRQASEQPRLSMLLLGSFAIIALVLALVGVAGVLAYTVARRTREIGVRMALGARRGEIASLVGRQAAWLVGVGVVVGFAAAFACSRLVEGQLHGSVVPTDPWTFAGVAVVLIVTAAGATYLPARRAATVDPLVALRAD
jgi:putative ABC transport system permease protein